MSAQKKATCYSRRQRIDREYLDLFQLGSCAIFRQGHPDFVRRDCPTAEQSKPTSRRQSLKVTRIRQRFVRTENPISLESDLSSDGRDLIFRRPLIHHT